MILCVAPSPAIDVTYEVTGFDVGRTNRVQRVTHRPGGKAVNVARVLTAIGERVLVLAPVGGPAGEEFRTGLAANGVAADLVDGGEPTRHTVTVVDRTAGTATVLSEPARITDWAVLACRFAELVGSATVVVISGSLPERAPADAIAQLIAVAGAAGRPVVVDTSGKALAQAVAAGPALVKPNADELTELTGERDPLTAVRALAGTHPITVVASLGADGLLAARSADVWRARPARPLHGNPTGAGDALVAGLARGLARGSRLPEMLADGIALSAAAVLQPYAGDVDPDEVRRQRAALSVEPLEAH